MKTSLLLLCPPQVRFNEVMLILGSLRDKAKSSVNNRTSVKTVNIDLDIRPNGSYCICRLFDYILFHCTTLRVIHIVNTVHIMELFDCLLNIKIT